MGPLVSAVVFDSTGSYRGAFVGLALVAIVASVPEMDSCEVRCGLDEAVCEALGLDGEFVGSVRRQLESEPSVTGNRYGG